MKNAIEIPENKELFITNINAINNGKTDKNRH